MELDTAAYDRYIASLFAPQDRELAETLQEMERANLRSINVSPVAGRLLQILALTVRAKRILEIGTLGGYSGLHFARTLPEDGKLITLELDPHHAAVARRNFDRADVGHKVDIRIGPASETLDKLAGAKVAPFDLIFIDANKGGYPEYFRKALPLLREGGLLVADNTLREALNSEKEKGANRYNAMVAGHLELTTTIIPILREDGLDGLTVSFKDSTTAGI